MVNNKQIRTNNLALKQFLARKRAEKNAEAKVGEAERTHQVVEEANRESQGTTVVVRPVVAAGADKDLEEGIENGETKKELGNENGVLAT